MEILKTPEEHAEINANALAQECNLPGISFQRNAKLDDPYFFCYKFILGKRKVDVLIPGESLEILKGEISANPAPPRLLVGKDKSSWYWEFAIWAIKGELSPWLATLGETERSEESIIGSTDDAPKRYRALVRRFLKKAADLGLDVDTKMDLTHENLTATRLKIEAVLKGLGLEKTIWPNFLKSHGNNQIDLSAIARNPFPGIESGKSILGFKPRSQCTTEEEYRDQVIQTSLGELHWKPHPRGIQWKSYFANSDNTVSIEIQTNSGKVIDRTYPGN